MKSELKDKIEKLSREQLIWVLNTIIDFEPLSRKSYNLIKYADAPHRTAPIQTGDQGQMLADRQYKHGC